MLILPPTPKNIKKARQIIKKGGVIIYPTDTLYGLGVDIFNLKAVNKIFEIKGRDFHKPLSVMVGDIAEIKKIAVLNKKQQSVVDTLLPGPFTLLLKKRNVIDKIITASSQKVGVRAPNSKICQALAKNLPLTTTSANLSGQKPTLNIKKLAKIFANKVDLILVDKNLSGQPSAVIDLTSQPMKILR